LSHAKTQKVNSHDRHACSISRHKRAAICRGKSHHAKRLAHAAGHYQGGEVMEWQPIETAPRDGTVIDLWTRRGTFYQDRWKRYADMWFAKGLGQWRNGRGDVFINEGIPTHWMPLPNPPEVQP